MVRSFCPRCGNKLKVETESEGTSYTCDRCEYSYFEYSKPIKVSKGSKLRIKSKKVGQPIEITLYGFLVEKKNKKDKK